MSDNIIKQFIIFQLVNVQSTGGLLKEFKNIFILQTHSTITRNGDDDLTSMNVSLNNPYTIVHAKFVEPNQILLYIVSSIVGFLIMIMITYSMYKCGFFKRNSKEEIQNYRASMRITIEQMKELSNFNE